MLQDLVRSAVAIARARGWTRVNCRHGCKFADLDLDECLPRNLAALADLAYRAGDLAFAEHCVDKLYAFYDRKLTSTDRPADAEVA